MLLQYEIKCWSWNTIVLWSDQIKQCPVLVVLIFHDDINENILLHVIMILVFMIIRAGKTKSEIKYYNIFFVSVFSYIFWYFFLKTRIIFINFIITRTSTCVHIKTKKLLSSTCFRFNSFNRHNTESDNNSTDNSIDQINNNNNIYCSKDNSWQGQFWDTDTSQQWQR